MLVWGQELIRMMIGGMRGTHMGMEFSLRPGESCCLSSVTMKPLCVTPGFQRELFTNRLGNIPSLNSGIASIMSS